MNKKSKVDFTTEQALQPLGSPLKAAAPRPSQTANRRFKVHAGVSLQAAAEVVVKASTPEEAGRLAEIILQGRPFAEQLHKILEHHTLSVPTQPGQHVDVRLESVLLDCLPEARVWKMTALGPKSSVLLTNDGDLPVNKLAGKAGASK